MKEEQAVETKLTREVYEGENVEGSKEGRKEKCRKSRVWSVWERASQGEGKDKMERRVCVTREEPKMRRWKENK